MHNSRAIGVFERRLFELGCPARYSRRSVAELAEHFEDSTRNRIEDGLEPEAARAQATRELGDPAIIADRLVASFRQASWWGRHPVIGFCLLPPLALMLFLPATVLSLYGLFLFGNLFSRHPIPLDEFKVAVTVAPAAFAEWTNPLLCFIHSVPIAINTVLFCKLVSRSASGPKWLMATCAVSSLVGFFTWTGFSPGGFYLGYGSPSVYNWVSAAVPLFIATLILLWRGYRLARISLPHEETVELFDSTMVGTRSAASPVLLEESRVAKRAPACLIKEEWLTPASAIAAAVVVISILLIKFVFTHDRADQARMEDLRNRIWPAERQKTLDFLQIRQALNETMNARTIALEPFATAFLADPVCWFGKTNFASLAELPHGVHSFAGVPFAISERVQLMGNGYKNLGLAFPSVIRGIPINQKCRFLYILHGASFLRTQLPTVPDGKGFIPMLPTFETTNLPVARLLLHYADGHQKKIEIIATQHLLDVWGPICASEVPVRERSVTSPYSELAWSSSRVPSEKSERLNSVRLYKTRFENPRPDTEILTIDYFSTRTEAAPFLLGLTIE